MTNSKSEEKKDTSEILQLVGFKIGNEEFGINILAVQEIIKIIDITTVPNASDYIAGVINLRGRIIPIVHLRKRLLLPIIETDKNTMILESMPENSFYSGSGTTTEKYTSFVRSIFKKK